MTFRDSLLTRTRAEQRISLLINEEITAAVAGHRPVDQHTARRIAACLHHGLGGELARFAGTGRLEHVEAARLEVFYAIHGEPGLRCWGKVHSGYLRHPPHINDESGTRRVAGLRSGPVSTAGVTADPDEAVAYLRTSPSDAVCRSGLALQMQYEACRDYARRSLHRRICRVFADRPGSHGAGMERLLAHLAICHNHRVVVHRLDRIPLGSPAANRIAAMGTRALSATEHHTRRLDNQATFNSDITHLTNAMPATHTKDKQERTRP